MKYLTITSLFFLFKTTMSVTIADHYCDYMWATYNQRQGNIPAAQAIYKHILDNNQSLYAYHGYVKHLATSNRHAMITTLIPKLDHHFKNNIEIQLIFAQAYEQMGDSKEAEQRYIQLNKIHKYHPEIAYNAAAALARQGDHKKALEVIHDYLNATVRQPLNFLFHFLEAQLYHHLKQNDKAMESIATCVHSSPEFYQGWLFYGLMYELSGKIHEAITGYQNYLRLVGNDPAIQQQLFSLLVKHQGGASPQNFNSYHTQATELYEKKEYGSALKFADKCLTLQSDHIPSHLIKIDCLCALRKESDACAHLRKLILTNPTEDLWFKTIHLLYQANINQVTIKNLLHELEVALPDHPLPILYLADIYIRENDLIKKVEYLQKSISIVKDPQLKTVALYQLALVLYEQGKFHDMQRVLEKGRALGEQYAPMLNLYAYWAATKGNDPLFAQQLLDSIKNEDKENSHILQTQAVILYKQNIFSEALKILKKLIVEEPNDYYVHFYYAKTLHKLRKKNEAVEMLAMAKPYIKTDIQKIQYQRLTEKWKINKKIHALHS
jgi:tetratricopeptide (TPR) repeat protein